MTDLVLRGGRIIDPASGRDETADLAFGDGRVTQIGRELPATVPRLSMCAGGLSCPV
jgi:predicted amidohydrolase